MKNKLISILLAVVLSTVFVPGTQKIFAAKVSNVNNTVVVKGQIKNSTGDGNVTLLLLKANSDLKKISADDIGYVSQQNTDSFGNYTFSFEFNDFEFDSSGNVKNYMLMLNQNGKNVTESITNAGAISEQLNILTDIKVSGNTADINGSIENTYGINIPVFLITALYNKSGTLTDVIPEKKQITPNTKTIGSRIDIKGKDVYKIKAFTWLNLNSAIPLCPATEYYTEEIFPDGNFEDENGIFENWATGKTMNCAVRTADAASSGKYSACFSNTSVSAKTVLDKGAALYSKNILPLIKKLGIGTYKLSVMVKSETSNAKFRAVLQTRKSDGTYVYDTLVEKSGENYIDISQDTWTKYTSEINIRDIDDISSMTVMFESPGKYNNVQYPAQKIFLDCISMRPVSVMEYSPAATTNIYLVGDSICTNYTENDKNQQGWGYYFEKQLKNENRKVFNCAKGGWSTDSFLLGQMIKTSAPGLTECELWSGISDSVKEGDYVVISLGHNDSSSTNFRATSKERYKDNLTNMIKDVKAKNATPILIASIPVVWDQYWQNPQDGSSKMLGREFQPVSVYGDCMKEVADNTQTAFIDLNTYMMNEYNELGMSLVRSKYYIDDNVHLNDYGARYVCNAIIKMLSEKNIFN